MTRRYKAFGLALVAMFVFGMLVAQGASAKPLTVEGGGPTWLTGDQDGGKFQFTTSSTFECNTVAFVAKSIEGATINELTLTPSYSGCILFGFAANDMKVNGCAFTFTTPTSIGVGQVTWGSSQLHITCPEGKKMEFTPTSFGVSICTQFLAAQTPTAGHVVGRNVASSNPMDITLEYTLSGIHFTGTGGACGTSSTTGTTTGNSTIKCYSDEAHTKQIGCTFS
jgi:hypothetical protein